MKGIIVNDIITTFRTKTTYLALFLLLGFGFLTGYKFTLSVGDKIAANASYSVGFMIGLLSLSLISIATLLAFSLLFKEKDANFSALIFTTPINKRAFAVSRFYSFFLISLFGFIILVMGYATGLHLQTEAQLKPEFKPWDYLYPLLIFGAINALVVCSMLYFIAQRFQNKLLVALAGLLLYILYLIAMMFSNAPFMAQSLPQSLFVQQISAIGDVFGLSGYFYEAKELNVLERNYQIVPFSNFLLFNRLFFILCSLGAVYLGVRSFSVLPSFKGKSSLQKKSDIKTTRSNSLFITSETLFNSRTNWKALFSFSKIDTLYIFKNIALVTVSILLVFFMGVEMFNAIEKGIRLPQHYASSGLLAETINASFYSIGALVMVYFVNDLFWRSHTSRFSIIENTTYYAKAKLKGHMGSIALIVLFLTLLVLFEAVLFQLLFNFPHIDGKAYWGVLVFNTFPLLLFSYCLLIINTISKNKSIALGVSILFFAILITPISKKIIPLSLLRFLSGYQGLYSDFIGYGPYLVLFLWRLAFGFSIIGGLTLLHHVITSKKKVLVKSLGITLSVSIAIVSSLSYLKGYNDKDSNTLITEKRAAYEKKYRKYQTVAQPIIERVNTEIDAYPKDHAYDIRGSYVLKNKHSQTIDSVLLNLPENFTINSVTFFNDEDTISIYEPNTAIVLRTAMHPQDTARLEFDLTYSWNAVNGHDPSNTIVENGSFTRISRYFPTFGYDSDKEIQDVYSRERYQLGNATGWKSLEAPKEEIHDGIQLDMVISTPKEQIAVGTGELMHYWEDNDRNYYHYTATTIPFRFALSLANYQIKQTHYKGINIRILYHPKHGNNVEHLIENTKHTLDYCTHNFGPYPLSSVTFAEVSSFTQGFAGTAYPGVIFMTENMIFNANIGADKNQDVVNELAGHEVSHFWWGTNQLHPDSREGHAMLTESLAMYTEMMVYKKIYGKEKMKERVAMHYQMYKAEKGFNTDSPLIRASQDQPSIAYSKGAIVFVELSELIGEKKLNLALKNFLLKHKYPNSHPVSTDLLEEVFAVTDTSNHEKILNLFL